MAKMVTNYSVLEDASRALIQESENALFYVEKLEVAVATAKASGSLTGYGIDQRISRLKSQLEKTGQTLNLEAKKLAAILAAYQEAERKITANASNAVSKPL